MSNDRHNQQLDYVPDPQDYRFEYPGVEGHLAQDYYDGRRKTVHAGKHRNESFDYYPIPHGIDYDDFYPGFSYFNPNDEHHYKDYSNSDGNSYDSYSSLDYSDEDTHTHGTYVSSFHDSFSGDAGYLHSHGLSHDSSNNHCGSGRCDTDTYHSQSHLDSINDSEYPGYYGYLPSSLATSDRADDDLTSSDSSDSYQPSSLGSSGVFVVNPYSVTFDSSDIDSDGYLTTHSSDYSNSSHGFQYGRVTGSGASDFSDVLERSDFDRFEHDGFGGYNYGIDPHYDYFGRDIHYFQPQRFEYPSNYHPSSGGYGIFKATASNTATGKSYRHSKSAPAIAPAEPTPN